LWKHREEGIQLEVLHFLGMAVRIVGYVWDQTKLDFAQVQILSCYTGVPLEQIVG